MTLLTLLALGAAVLTAAVARSGAAPQLVPVPIRSRR